MPQGTVGEEWLLQRLGWTRGYRRKLAWRWKGSHGDPLQDSTWTTGLELVNRPHSPSRPPASSFSKAPTFLLQTWIPLPGTSNGTHRGP